MFPVCGCRIDWYFAVEDPVLWWKKDRDVGGDALLMSMFSVLIVRVNAFALHVKAIFGALSRHTGRECRSRVR